MTEQCNRILCIDHGTKYIGVAISDPLCITAQALCTIDAKPVEKAIEKIQEIVREKGVRKIIVGLPYNMDGSEGRRCIAARRFAQRLRQSVSVPVEGFDERLSTVEADRSMLMADLSRHRRRRLKDQVAAQIILQRYLERLRGRMRTGKKRKRK